jgi:hypothetical protein
MTVFARSHTEVVSSNPTQGIDVCVMRLLWNTPNTAHFCPIFSVCSLSNLREPNSTEKLDNRQREVPKRWACVPGDGGLRILSFVSWRYLIRFSAGRPAIVVTETFVEFSSVLEAASRTVPQILPRHIYTVWLIPKLPFKIKSILYN